MRGRLQAVLYCAIAAVMPGVLSGCAGKGVARNQVSFLDYEQVARDRLENTIGRGVGVAVLSGVLSGVIGANVETLFYEGEPVEFDVLAETLPSTFGGHVRNGEWPKALASLDPMLIGGENDAAWFAAGVCHEKMADDVYVVRQKWKRRETYTVFSRSDSNLDEVIRQTTKAHTCYTEANRLKAKTRYEASVKRIRQKLQFVLEWQRRVQETNPAQPEATR